MGTDWQSQKGGKGSWGQETASPGAGWALQTPRRYSRCGGREQGQTEEERKCTWKENTQNLRHQTDKEVAFWGQRNTEEAPREALRYTSRISPARLAHSDHPANTFRQEWRDDNVSCAQTHSSQRHVDLEDKDGTARLHRVQSNPGDTGVTWELLGQTYCPTMAGLGRDKMETKHVTLRGQVYPCHPLEWVDIQEGIHPVVPGHSPQGLKPSASLVHHSHVNPTQPGRWLLRCAWRCDEEEEPRLGNVSTNAVSPITWARPKSKYQHSSGRLAVPVGLGTSSLPPAVTGQAQLAEDQSVSTTSSSSLFSSPSESSSSLYRYISPSATECLSSVPSPSSRRLQVLMMTGMLGSRPWGS